MTNLATVFTDNLGVKSASKLVITPIVVPSAYTEALLMDSGVLLSIKLPINFYP
ncbi:MAG: hypothetical protein ACJAXY_000078 [Nonlabens sp.]|jgi:hypothetical protein|uniref:hypothetical protein n=1 Tax=Nonlabens sp. TaxID=1888209 RepID=UPI0039E31BBB